MHLESFTVCAPGKQGKTCSYGQRWTYLILLRICEAEVQPVS
jgi:hypothetical protein